MSWADPVVAPDFDDQHDRGPVLVTIGYEIDAVDTDAFLQAIYELSGERYRDGAYDWGIYQDAADPRSWTEWFFVASWAEHLRQHERVTRHDHGIHTRARAFHRGESPPEARHHLAPNRRGAGARSRQNTGGAPA